jgi:hypothetical protein
MRRASLTLATGLVSSSLALSAAWAEPLTPAQRAERAARIRDVAADNGISAGFLLAGIAQAETNLSHCWSELTWACEGPASPDCDGGPVVAGAGDGPCSLMEGGLGMFQFDGGTFDETLARDGDGVLLLAGNVTRAVDFVVDMVMRSTYVDASTPAEAKAWMNQVTVDGPLWEAWITTVTHYYNGCVPGVCGVFDDRYAHYDASAADVYAELGEAFWQVELPPCAPVPPEGRALEETDRCFEKGGPLPYWRVGMGGESELHVWTGTIDAAEPTNFARWSLELDEAGTYLVEVSVPPGGTTPQARYEITHGGVVDEVVVDQGATTGWVSLGELEFAAGGGQAVLVGDDTGDVESERLVVDALRLTRVDVGQGGGGAGGQGGAGGAPSGGAGGAEGDVVPSPAQVTCVCGLGRASGSTWSGAALCALGLAALSRRATGRRPRGVASARRPVGLR